jgi:hypothetical protein
MWVGLPSNGSITSMTESNPSSAGCHAVGDRSFWRRVLAVILSTLLGWPGWRSSMSTEEPRSTAVQGGSHIGVLKTKTSREFSRRAGLVGHQHPVGGVLDDDPAILPEDSEDWIEGRAVMVMIVGSVFAPSASITGTEPLSSGKTSFLSQSGPFHGPARFRC